ncbi:hypothetical protein [Notoacmeibacter ruber]|nr:hypothetical protein [Notoacmeibacter ruber]
MPDTNAFLMNLVEQAGPVAAGIAVVLLILFFGLKWSGAFAMIGSGKSVIDNERLDQLATGIENIGERLGSIEGRVAHVERGLDDRVRRSEVHDLDIALARMEGRLDMMAAASQATGASVTRIEDYLLQLSQNAKNK